MSAQCFAKKFFVFAQEIVVVLNYRAQVLNRVVGAAAKGVLACIIGVGNVLVTAILDYDKQVIRQFKSVASEVSDPDLSVVTFWRQACEVA
jgi:hypothetical protein